MARYTLVAQHDGGPAGAEFEQFAFVTGVPGFSDQIDEQLEDYTVWVREWVDCMIRWNDEEDFPAVLTLELASGYRSFFTLDREQEEG